MGTTIAIIGRAMIQNLWHEGVSYYLEDGTAMDHVHEIRMAMLHGPHTLEIHSEISTEKRQREEDDGSKSEAAPGCG